MIPASLPAPPDIAAACQRAEGQAPAMRLDLRWYASLTSTMDIAEEAARAGAPEGLVIAAEEQTAGRGRRGHQWSSPAGAGLYLTFVLRPPPLLVPGERLGLLTLGVGVAVHAALARATGLVTDLKWPNDVMVGRRKLAGILAEGVGLGSAEPIVLVGLGVNLHVAAHPGEVAARATSLEDELGRGSDRALVLEALLVEIAQTYDALRRGNADDILRAWRAAAPSAQGAPVSWAGPAGPQRGTTAGIDDSGALLVRTAGGLERIVGGVVHWD